MKVKAAILGAGNMGKGHAKRLKEAGAQVVSVCDKSAAARENFMTEVNDSSIKEYSDFAEMLEKEEIQALFICIPPFAQKGQFEQAAQKGIHIFIEKPIALNTEVGKKMVEAAENNGIITRVGFHMRQGAAVKKLKGLIAEGKAGRPVLFHGDYYCNSLHTPWWRNVDLCGGQIFEQAIHVYDMCRNLMGDPKYAIGLMNNLCHSNVEGYTVEDVSASLAGFTNGSIASITANNCEVPGKWTGSFKVIFENLTADFEDFNHAVFTYTNQEPVVTEKIESDEDAYVDEVKDFITCIEEGRDTECNIKEGYKSLCYVEKVVESAKMDGVKAAVK
jgi:predicted dehydrogenase